MKAIATIAVLLTIPLFVLNVFGAIISGIWLALLSEWSNLILGVISFVGSTWILGLALLPAFAIGAPAIWFAKLNNVVGVIAFGFLANLYTLALVVVWCSGILFFVMSKATPSNFVPLLIWSYCIATGPWAYMAKGEQGDGNQGFGASLIVFFTQLAYLTVMVTLFFTSLSYMEAVLIFSGFMLVALIVQVASMTALTLQEARRAEEVESDTPTGSSFNFEEFRWPQD